MTDAATLAGLAGLALTANSLGVTTWAQARWPARGRRLSTPLGAAHVLDTGDGPPVVLLHGAASSACGVTVPLADRLADHRLIAPDRPGAGHTPVIAGHDRLEVQAAFIAHILEALGVARAVVFGHSWGCAVALRLALDHPDRVTALVLAAPASHPWDGDTSLVNRIAASPVIGHALSFIAPPLLGPLIAPRAVARGFAPSPAPPDYIVRTAVPLGYRPSAFRANARDMAAANSELAAQAPRYRDIACPVAIVTGEGDQVVWNRIHAKGLAEVLPQADCHRVPKGGHMPHWADPDLTVRLIREAARQAGVRSATRTG
jgi:pimeloyl-ACP methyl ester carboxylesterase